MVEMTIKSKKHYVNNTDFCSALTTYKKKVEECEKANLPKPPIPNYIGECFIKIAEGFGVPGRKITHVEELKDAVAEMLAHAGPYLLHVQVLKEDNVFPMVPAGAAVDEIVLEHHG